MEKKLGKKAFKNLSYVAVGFLAAGFIGFSGVETAKAEGGPEVSGYIDTTYNVMAERRSSGGGKANTRRDFHLVGEIDVEKKWARTGVRLDADLNTGSSSNAAAGINSDTTFEIEQARADWWLPVGEEFMTTFTVGAWNGLLGGESQDAPDLLQISTGQLFDLVPANMLGVNLAGGVEMVTVNLFAANEWRANTTKENSVGTSVSLRPIEGAHLKVGAIVNPDQSARRQGIVNVVAETTLVPMTFLQAELTAEDQNRGLAFVANVTHDSEMPHWLTLRYDNVRSHAGSSYGTGIGSVFGLPCGGVKCIFQTVTAAVGVEVTEGLATILEYKAGFGETDVPSGTDISQDLHEITLEWVATF